MMDEDVMIKARAILNPLWIISWLKGRCWGFTSKKNPYSKTNITLALRDEIITISSHDGKVIVHEFIKANKTRLGTMARELLSNGGIEIEKAKYVSEKIAPKPPFFMWSCQSCSNKGFIEYEDGDDMDLVLKKIFLDHDKTGKQTCQKTSLKIIDHEMRDQGEFLKSFFPEKAAI